MGGLFSRKKKPNPSASASVTEQDRAILVCAYFHYLSKL